MYENNETEYSKSEVSLNIYMVVMLIFPGVLLSCWSQNMWKPAGAYWGMQSI